MEAVGLVASVIAVIQISESVIDLCKQYISAVQDAPRDLSLILIEASALKGLLDPIRLLVESSRLLPQNESLSKPVEECQRVLSDLEKLIGNGNKNAEPSRRKRKRTLLSLEALAWPLKRSKAMKLLEDLTKYKSTIGLILLADAAAGVNTLSQDVKEVKESLDETKSRAILDWLVEVDPSPNHRQAQDLHEEHTSQWITSCPEWDGWAAGKSRFMWIYGIPGAGKTILASFVIDYLRDQCRDDERTPRYGHAYYYCYHARSHNDDVGAFLGWIISQLSRQCGFIPPGVVGSYSLGNRPNMSTLLRPLKLIAERFHRVFIVIDALDESQSRPKFLEFLRFLSLDAFSNIQVIITSRDEIDIRAYLEPLCISLSMANPYVDQDINRYVHSELHSDPKFGRWPQDLLQNVEDALSKGAKGMFRWAACQLQILRRLNQRSAIEKAITALPETLDETYERILCSIPSDSRKIACRALELLCAEYLPRISTAEQLLEAVFWGDSKSRYPQDQLLGVDSLHEICVCLVTISHEPESFAFPAADRTIPQYTGHGIKLAHYTVKEFLVSARIREGPARHFQVSNEQAHISYRQTILQSFIRSCGSNSPVKSDFFDFCWYLLPSVLKMHMWLPRSEGSEDIDQLVYTLLDPRNEYISRCARGPVVTWVGLGPVFPLSHWGSPADEGPAPLIAQLLVLGLEPLADAFLSRLRPKKLSKILKAKISFDCFRDCRLLDIALATREELHIGACRILSKYQCLRPTKRTLFYLATLSDRSRGELLGDSRMLIRYKASTRELASDPDLMRCLLDAGMDPSPVDLPATPLQVALDNRAWGAARHLLEAGADPNETGNVETALPSGWVNFDMVKRATSPLEMCQQTEQDGKKRIGKFIPDDLKTLILTKAALFPTKLDI